MDSVLELLRFLSTNFANEQTSVGMPAIAAAVASLECCMITVDCVFLCEIARLLQIGKHMIAFRVDIGRDVMRNLTGGVA